jgi:signal transduction histidine kinase
MQTDVTRLQRVANRFGQIGSRPELEENDVNQLLEETANYFRRRLPFDGKGVTIHFNPGSIPNVNLNGELFTWAIENLIKNSLQAVSPQTGEIMITSYLTKDEKHIAIDIKDNGPGIPIGIARKIFRPGFSTKKRGWGLGLTLTRRIIENYHRGQITLTRTQPGETLFRIVLPVKSDERVNNYWFSKWTKTNI